MNYTAYWIQSRSRGVYIFYILLLQGQFSYVDAFPFFLPLFFKCGSTIHFLLHRWLKQAAEFHGKARHTVQAVHFWLHEVATRRRGVAVQKTGEAPAVGGLHRWTASTRLPATCGGGVLTHDTRRCWLRWKWLSIPAPTRRFCFCLRVLHPGQTEAFSRPKWKKALTLKVDV